MMKITQDVLESYVACRYKAFLKLWGHKGATAHNGSPLLEELSTTACEDKAVSLPSETRTKKVIELTSRFLENGIDSVANCL